MKRMGVIAALLAGLLVPPAGAMAGDMQVLDSYYAYLGDADHYNSKGTRLAEYWQVIRQDRANYHRFGIQDPYDEPDTLFDDPNSRALLETLLRQNPLPKSEADMIVSGEVLIGVEIYSDGATPKAVNVEILPLGE